MKIIAFDSRSRPVENPLERRDSMCTECVTIRGVAFAVVVGRQQKTVSYRCPACGRIWEQRRDDALQAPA